MPDVSTAQKDRLMNDLRVVIADAEELMRTTASEVGEGAAEALAPPARQQAAWLGA
jgi:ElaB/YqjD/DUF883 family membrane-anchored ribosome-binding protein